MGFPVAGQTGGLVVGWLKAGAGTRENNSPDEAGSVAPLLDSAYALARRDEGSTSTVAVMGAPANVSSRLPQARQALILVGQRVYRARQIVE